MGGEPVILTPEQIRPGVRYRCGPHRLALGDLQAGDVQRVLLPGLAQFTAVYSDPPWGQGNLKYWRTVAGQQTTPQFSDFMRAFSHLAGLHRSTDDPAGEALIEMGIRWEEDLKQSMRAEQWLWSSSWRVHYGHPPRPNLLMHFVRQHGRPFPGLDQSLTGDAVRAVGVKWLVDGGHRIVLDPCLGLGGTLRACHQLGVTCYGSELNPARLARSMAWIEKETKQPVEEDPHG